ncbi:hypothetical protein H4W32_001670 [Actinophytocola algeriensis]|uniref:Uncharacterized protein n=1 Tax=Actinophytocola algeriensis TaxID=1768010 RepID=A0A7W7VI19_9PSEU|nr:hypothetical protein [Actinophytocola algeriensis]MBE1473628.1 hypothetical protein [Actinophytocola algeriensis]
MLPWYQRGAAGRDFKPPCVEATDGWGLARCVGVSGVGAGDSVSEVSFDPGEVVWRSQWVQMSCAATRRSRSPGHFQRWS